MDFYDNDNDHEFALIRQLSTAELSDIKMSVFRKSSLGFNISAQLHEMEEKVWR